VGLMPDCLREHFSSLHCYSVLGVPDCCLTQGQKTYTAKPHQVKVQVQFLKIHFAISTTLFVHQHSIHTAEQVNIH
jgi:hypothetical protein